ncbi:MAG TPA: DNA cytosine methyltransferase [Alphaproteobacteria bacterium]|nr:DNA cytosine methyltransferase [Alphaproteobacteria bacterium]
MVAAHLINLKGEARRDGPADEPAFTQCAGGFHIGEVRAFLLKYYGTKEDGVELKEPMHTVTAKDRLGLVTVHGEEYQIVDIGMRMLTPRELYRAQGFPESTIIGDDPAQGLSLTKTAQVRMCGNSVCPPLAAAIVRVNFSTGENYASEAAE